MFVPHSLVFCAFEIQNDESAKATITENQKTGFHGGIIGQIQIQIQVQSDDGKATITENQNLRLLGGGLGSGVGSGSGGSPEFHLSLLLVNDSMIQ